LRRSAVKANSAEDSIFAKGSMVSAIRTICDGNELWICV
jgi:hypothetical protein